MQPSARRTVAWPLRAAAAWSMLLWLAAPAAAAEPPVLTRVDTVTPITDVVAVRTDGLAIAQVGDDLRLVDAQGGTYPFADAAMRALTRGDRRPRLVALAPVVAGGGACPWRPNDLVVGVPGDGDESLWILDAQGGQTGWRSSLADGTALAASFDGTGRFGGSLLILERRGDGAAVEEVDCHGRRTEVAAGIAGARPGIAVLPAGAGGGLGGAAVVATDAGPVTVTPGGAVAALRVDGWSATLQAPVAGLAAVPPRFVEGTGRVDVAGAAGLLQVGAADLGRAGLHDGDLLAATGSPAALVAVHCEGGACTAQAVARAGAGRGGASGRPALLPTQVGGDVVLPRDAQGAGWTTVGILGAALAALVVPGVLRLRRRRAALAELEERFLDHHPAHRGDQR